MKSLLLTIAVITSVSTGVVIAKQDTNKAAVKTVVDQSSKPADLDTLKSIRRDLMNDNSLSTKAKNVVVIVANNGVTLKGEVNTQAEREVILKHANLKAPNHRIYNQISIVK